MASTSTVSANSASSFCLGVRPNSAACLTALIRSAPGVRQPVLRWPYMEGLRMDEAMHPLTILATGLYGEVLPKQDAA